METDEAPPPKKRVTTKVAKLLAKAEPKRKSSKTMYATLLSISDERISDYRALTKYPGIRPVFSVNGTKSRGNKAAPTFQLAVAQYRFGNGSFCTLNRAAM